MNELLESVIKKVGVFLLDKGYSIKGKNDFVKKTKENGKEEIISFTHRNGRGDSSNYIYIGVTSGIYFKKVNNLDKKIIKDFLNSYPILSGSIGSFRKHDSGFISIPICNLEQSSEVSRIIIDNIELGAFNLFNTYPNLESIILGIDKKDEWLKDYTEFLDFRNSIRLAAIYCIEKGKEYAISWFDKSQPKSKEKEEALFKMEKEW